MFHEDPDTGNYLILDLLLSTACLISLRFLWLIRTDVLRLKSLEACIFQEDTPRRTRLVFFITNAFLMDASSKDVTAIAYQTLCKIDAEGVFHGVVFFLPLSFSCGSVGSCGRCRRRSVPSRMPSTATQRASVWSRCFGALAGNAGASPRAMCQTVLRACIHALTRPGLVSKRNALTSCQG